MTPKGIPVCVPLEEKTSGADWAECAVRKDAGDDYDVTNGILWCIRILTFLVFVYKGIHVYLAISFLSASSTSKIPSAV